MKDSVLLDGKIYISSRRAAEISHYTTDYVGQLCRAGKVDCRIVGRAWFVTEESLLKHQTMMATSLSNSLANGSAQNNSANVSGGSNTSNTSVVAPTAPVASSAGLISTNISPVAVARQTPSVFSLHPAEPTPAQKAPIAPTAPVGNDTGKTHVNLKGDSRTPSISAPKDGRDTPSRINEATKKSHFFRTVASTAFAVFALVLFASTVMHDDPELAVAASAPFSGVMDQFINPVIQPVADSLENSLKGTPLPGDYASVSDAFAYGWNGFIDGISSGILAVLDWGTVSGGQTSPVLATGSASSLSSALSGSSGAVASSSATIASANPSGSSVAFEHATAPQPIVTNNVTNKTFYVTDPSVEISLASLQNQIDAEKNFLNLQVDSLARNIGQTVIVSGGSSGSVSGSGSSLTNLDASNVTSGVLGVAYGGTGLTSVSSSAFFLTDSSGNPYTGTTLPAFTLGGAVVGNNQNLTGLNQLVATTLSVATSTAQNVVASSSLILPYLAGFGSEQCLQIDSNGLISASGSACGNGGTGGVNIVSNSDGTLTITPTTGAVVASLNLSHANTWLGAQTFNATSTFASTTFNGQATFKNNLAVLGATTLGSTTLGTTSASALSVGNLSGLLFGTNGTVGTISTSSLGLSTSSIIGLGTLASLNGINNSNWIGTPLAVTNGGLGTSTAPTQGEVLVGNASNGYDLVSTSSLGFLTTDVAEGTNLYYTTARAQADARTAISVTGLPLTYSGGVIGINQASSTASGYLSAADWNTFNGKQPAGAYLTGNQAITLSGDLSGSGTTSIAAILATVNSNVGSFGSSTAIPTFTVNAKGLITAAGTTSVIAPAGTLTGTTLASNIVTSSLASVGTLTSGSIASGFGNVNIGSNVFTGNGSGLTNISTSSLVGVLGVGNGGTGTSSAPGLSQLLIGNGTGGYNFVGTSSLGLLSANAIGSGLAGQIAYYAANGTILSATSSIYVSTTTGFVGIGTTSPSNNLEVNGSAYIGGKLTVASAVATGTLNVSGTTTLASSLNGVLFGTNGVVGTISTSSLGLSTSSIAGLGLLASLNSINNGNWSGTALSVANGGTGLSSASTSAFFLTNSSGNPYTGTTTPAFTFGGTVTGNNQNLTGLNLLTSAGGVFTNATTTNLISTNNLLTNATSTNLFSTNFTANGTVAFSGITGTTSCLQVNALGVLSGSGAACGSGGGGGAVNSVSNSDGTLTITPTTGAVVASLNLAHSNTWTGAQTFSATTTLATTSATSLSASQLTISGIANISGTTTLASSLNGLLFATNGLVSSLATSSITNLSNLSTVGTLTSGSIASGFGNVNIGSNVFTGNGSGLTNISTSSLVGVLGVGNGGTGTSTALANELLIGNAAGTGWTEVSTSSLGITSSQWTTSGSNIYYNVAGGNVGIGTTSPTALLTVEGTTTTSSATPLFNVASSSNASLFNITGNGDVNIPAGVPTFASSTLGGSLTSMTSVYVSGKYAYSVGGTTSSNSYLAVFDITNPAAPVLVASTTSGLNTPKSVFVAGRYAYVASNSNASFIIFDVSNPASPVQLGSIASGISGVNSIYVSGRYAYVTEGTGFAVIDVSNPASPVVASLINRGLGASGPSIFVSGRYAYMARSSATTIFDISNPVLPAQLGSFTLSTNPTSVYVSGRYAYITAGTGGLYIYNVSNPASPVQVGSTTSGLSNATWVFVSGRYAYVADATNGLVTFDVSNPASPVKVATVISGLSAPQSVYVSGHYAYIADTTKGLVSFDLGGGELNAANIGALEAGNLQVRNDILAQGQIQANGGLNVGAGGIFSSGPLSVSVASSTQTNALSAYFQGFVGIGTTTPSNALEVVGNGYFAGNFTATGTLSVGGSLNVSGTSTLATTSATSLSASQLTISGIANISGTTTLASSLNGLLFATNGLVSSLATSSITNLSNLSTVGTLTSGSIASGFGNVNIGSNVFTGNGSGLTNISTSSLVGVLGVGNGGTGTSSAPGLSQLLIGNGTGGYNFVGTSSLGLLSANAIGSGLAGQIAYYAANGTILSATSSIYVSTTTGFVGIGTTSPSNNLEVNGSAYIGGKLTVASAVATGTLNVSGTTTLASSLNGVLFGTNGVVGTISTSSLGLSTSSIAGLGLLASLNSINNGNWSGTALSVANGGTGLSSASTSAFFLTNSSGNPYTGTTTPAFTFGGTVTGNNQNLTGLNLLTSAGGVFTNATTTNLISTNNLLTNATSTNLFSTNFTANGTVAFSGITGTTSCLQVNALGVLSGSGAACGSGGGGGAVNSVSNSDGTLTITPTTGAVVASLNLAHSNTWTGAQTFSATTTLATTSIASLSVTGAGTTTLGGGIISTCFATTTNGPCITGGGSGGGGVSLSGTNTWTGQQTFSTVAPIFSTMTQGSIFFAGAGGLLSQNNANFFWDNTNSALDIGTTSSINSNQNVGEFNVIATTTNETNLALFQANVNNYAQVAVVNANAGATSSADFIVGNNLNSANSSSYYGDFGINSSGNADTNFTGLLPDDTYLYGSDGGLDLGSATSSASSTVKFFTGGLLSANQRMVITSTGLVGIGTTSPSNMLEVNGNGYFAGNFGIGTTTGTTTIASNVQINNGSFAYDNPSGVTNIDALQTGALNFDTDAGSVSWADLPIDSTPTAGTIESFSAQIGDVPILTVYSQANGSATAPGGQNFAVGIGTTTPIATLAVTGFNGYSPFIVASSTGTQLLTLLQNGNFGISTSTPSTTLDVAGDITDENVKNCDSTTAQLGSDVNGRIVCNLSLSDARLKNTATPLTDTDGLVAVMALNPVSFYWTDPSIPGTGSTQQQFGFLAQDVANVLPNLVGTTTSVSALTPGFTYVLNYQGIIPVLAKAIQDEQVEITALQASASSSAAALLNAASTTATTLSGSSSFIQTIANAVLALLQAGGQAVGSAGNWVMNQLSANVGVFNSEVDTPLLKTQTAVVSNGIQMTDSATGYIYCVQITAGQLHQTLGACSTVATSTPVTATSTAQNGQSDPNQTLNTSNNSSTGTVISSAGTSDSSGSSPSSISSSSSTSTAATSTSTGVMASTTLSAPTASSTPSGTGTGASAATTTTVTTTTVPTTVTSTTTTVTNATATDSSTGTAPSTDDSSPSSSAAGDSADSSGSGQTSQASSQTTTAPASTPADAPASVPADPTTGN